MKSQEVGENSIMWSFINLFSSTSIIRMIKSRRTRWAGNLARLGEKKNAYNIGGKSRRKETAMNTMT
jgi:hypothetical protein